MKVDIVNVFRIHLGIFESVFHHESCSESPGMSGCDMVGVGAHASTRHFRVDMCSASFSVLQFFKHESAACLRRLQSRRGFRRMGAMRFSDRRCVSRGLHGVEASNACGIDCGFSTAGNNGVGHAEAHDVEGVDERVVGRCAGRYSAEAGTAELMVDGDVSCGYVGNHFRNEERVVFRTLLLAVEGIVSGLFLKSVEAADSGKRKSLLRGFYQHSRFQDSRR